MIFRNCPYVDHILHALVSIVILVSQLYLIFSYDHAHDLREAASAVGVTAVILLLIQHIVRAIQTSSGDEDEMTKKRSSAIRNFLTLIALTAEFIALAVEVGKPAEKQLDALTLPSIIVVSLSLMRLLDSIMDQSNIQEAFGVQCVKDPWGLRVILIHLLIALSVGLQVLKMYEWNKDDGAHNHLHQSVKDLDTSVLVLSCIHLLIYPLNKALKACQLDKMLIQCSCLRCFKGQTNENCDSDRAAQDQDLELVAITRLPFVRQLIAGVIIAGNAYVFGAAINNNELTYQIPAALLYACADVAGRNYM
jgi:hypothetical protein